MTVGRALMRVPDEAGLIAALRPDLQVELVGEHENTELERWAAALKVRGCQGVDLDPRRL